MMILSWFTSWCRPKFEIHFVEPAKETNPIAQQAIEGLQKAIENLQRSLAFVEELRDELARVRSELAAYAVGCMDADAQIAKLERMRLKETRKKDV
jgi:hypothetical protein